MTYKFVMIDKYDIITTQMLTSSNVYLNRNFILIKTNG